MYCFLFYFLYASEMSDNVHITKMGCYIGYSYINIAFQSDLSYRSSSVGEVVYVNILKNLLYP